MFSEHKILNKITSFFRIFQDFLKLHRKRVLTKPYSLILFQPFSVFCNFLEIALNWSRRGNFSNAIFLYISIFSKNYFKLLKFFVEDLMFFIVLNFNKFFPVFFSILSTFIFCRKVNSKNFFTY